MRYSLLNRFQGALVGSLLGEVDSQTDTISLPHQISFYLMDKLIVTSGYLDNNWAEELNQDLIKSSSRKLTSGELAIALLPIILFFHDNLELLTQQLKSAFQTWLQKDNEPENILLWSYIVALILTEKFNPSQKYDQLAASLPKKAQLITQLYLWWQQDLVLDSITHQLADEMNPDDIAIIKAIYLFIQTPEEFELSLKRVQAITKSSLVISSLTGALAGAYNSWIGIEVRKRILINENLGFKRGFQKSQNLFNLWCGVYNLEATNLDHNLAIASANMIQKRDVS